MGFLLTFHSLIGTACFMINQYVIIIIIYILFDFFHRIRTAFANTFAVDWTQGNWTGISIDECFHIFFHAVVNHSLNIYSNIIFNFTKATFLVY